MILSPCARIGQSPVANQAATKFSQVVSIAPASAARISVTVADQAGQQQAIEIGPEGLSSYGRFQRFALKHGVVFVNPLYEHSVNRFRRWRATVDKLLVDCGNAA